MEQKKIDRINELYKKSKAEGLTPEEAKEQKILRKEYMELIRVNLRSQLNNIDMEQKDGSIVNLGEKYGEKVRVVSMGDYSIELCGGTHVSNTNAISSFKIISESGVAAGVRRIEALTSTGLMKHYKESENVLNQAAKLAKSEPVALVEKIQALYDEIKEF